MDDYRGVLIVKLRTINIIYRAIRYGLTFTLKLESLFLNNNIDYASYLRLKSLQYIAKEVEYYRK